jgi:hypothetical protein
VVTGAAGAAGAGTAVATGEGGGVVTAAGEEPVHPARTITQVSRTIENKRIIPTIVPPLLPEIITIAVLNMAGVHGGRDPFILLRDG